MSEYYLQGTEVPNSGPSHTLVYMATHDGAGNSLPQKNRSFISFSYGGKLIEDFGLIAITDGDSITRNIYADFNDNVSNYDALDGQFYWDSHFEKYELSLKLVTDGITELQLGKFKSYFVPGPAKELILMENPNRGIQARISKPPEYEMLVYEKVITKKVGWLKDNNGLDRTISVSTTLYKGFINLTFVMDDPIWYSIHNYFSTAEPDEDTLKVILEDNVPNLSMLLGDMFIGEGYYYNGNMLSNGTTSLTAQPNDARYLYYAGTADGKPIISFDIIPVIDSSEAYIVDINYSDDLSKIWNGSIGAIIGTGAYIYLAHSAGIATEPGNTFYVREPKNAIYKKIDTSSKEYNELQIGDSIFKFTTPSIYTGYNLAIEIFSNLLENDSLIELRAKVRDGIKENYSRSWALAALNCLISYRLAKDNSDSLNATVTDGETLVKMMWAFLLVPDEENNNEIGVAPAKLTFNSKTGEAKGTFIIREWANITYDFGSVNNYNELVTYFKDSGNYNKRTITQNIGDMVYDKYLVIEDKNEPNENGYITTDLCSKITTDFTNSLNNLKIEYDYLYL